LQSIKNGLSRYLEAGYNKETKHFSYAKECNNLLLAMKIPFVFMLTKKTPNFYFFYPEDDEHFHAKPTTRKIKTNKHVTRKINFK